MKIHAQEIFKRNLQFILFLGMCLISIIMILFNLKVLKSNSKPLIIGIDANGSRIISEQNDPIYKTEAINFIQKFAFNTYNFNSENFMKRIGLSTSMMSEDLWKKKRNEILDLKSKIERDEIEVAGVVQKITRDESGSYHGLIQVTEKSRLNSKEHIVEVTILLNPTLRTQDNPYGLEISSYEESIINN